MASENWFREAIRSYVENHHGQPWCFSTYERKITRAAHGDAVGAAAQRAALVTFRSYVENHQGCPWCLGANRVYKSERNGVTEYRCGCCDFLACYDKQAGRYYM